MRHKNEFFGIATYEIIKDENGNGAVNWVIKNPELTRGHTQQIEDGDYLELVDNAGNLKLKKIIVRDYDSFYSEVHKRQICSGTTVAWLPLGIAYDYWWGVFNRGMRAKLIKAEDVENADI